MSNPWSCWKSFDLNQYETGHFSLFPACAVTRAHVWKGLDMTRLICWWFDDVDLFYKWRSAHKLIFVLAQQDDHLSLSAEGPLVRRTRRVRTVLWMAFWGALVPSGDSDRGGGISCRYYLLSCVLGGWHDRKDPVSLFQPLVIKLSLFLFPLAISKWFSPPSYALMLVLNMLSPDTLP